MLKNTPLRAAAVVRSLSGGRRQSGLSPQQHRKSRHLSEIYDKTARESAKLMVEADTGFYAASALIVNKYKANQR